MELLIFCFIVFFLIIFCFLFSHFRILKKQADIKERTFLKAVLTKKELLEMCRKDYGTHSWYKKMKK